MSNLGTNTLSVSRLTNSFLLPPSHPSHIGTPCPYKSFGVGGEPRFRALPDYLFLLAPLQGGDPRVGPLAGPLSDSFPWKE